MLLQTVTLSFFRFESWLDRIWAFVMMGLARPGMARVPGIGFWKLCGSGVGEGFTPLPNTAVYAILATWPDEETAKEQTANAKMFKRYQARATEHWTVFLQTTSARGHWTGVEPFAPQTNATPGPLAALTRATIKPSVAMQFWRRVPDISDVIGNDPNVAFKIGIGEVPWFHQVTFSIWPDTKSMTAFARADGPHARAIRAVREGNWFSEELYARFAVVGDAGSWGGCSPLTGLERP
ncbi:MAG: spheroidene monooxygenase [Marinovum sp.]|nr:spheroidene monooxygenase [Marinovum sp.]